MMQTFSKPNLRAMPKDISHIPLYRWMWKEIYWKNSNFILINSGKPGKGKSWISLGIGYDFDRMVNGGHRFGFKTHVAPTAKYFLELINDMKSPTGTVRILDESSIVSGANSRQFSSLENKLMSSLTQIMRHRNQLIIYNSPNKGYIDRQVRDLAHAQIYAQGHDNLFNYAKFVFLEDNMFSDNVYTIYPRYINAQGDLVVADEIQFFKPPKSLTQEYEEAMDVIKKNWEKEYLAEYELIKASKEELGEIKLSLSQYQAKVLENPMECFDNQKNKFEQALVEYYLQQEGIGISLRDLPKVTKLLNLRLRKGEINI